MMSIIDGKETDTNASPSAYGCDIHGWCKNYNCCRGKGLNGCWECDDFPCSGGMLDKPQIRAFARFAKEYGTDEFAKCLLRNREKIQCHKFVSLNDFIEFRNVKIRDDIHRDIVSLFYPYLSSVSGDSSKLPNAIGAILNMDLSSVKAVTGCFNELSSIDYPYDNTDFYILFDNGIKVYIYGSFPLKKLVNLDSDQYAVFITNNTITGSVIRKANNHIYIQ